MGRSSSKLALPKVEETAPKAAATVARNVSSTVDFKAIKQEIAGLLDAPGHDYGTLAPLLIRLGWHCSGTFDPSKPLVGGSNRTGICHSPEKDDPENKGLEKAVKLLQGVHKNHPGISFSDLVILASYTALEETDGPKLGIVFSKLQV